MRKKYQVVLMIICWSLLYLVGSFAGEDTKNRMSKVGGLKLPEHAFGFFGTARHLNKDSTFTDFVNYHAEFALWMGAKTSQGEVLVTSGNGNEITRRPEWNPVRHSIEEDFDPGFPQVDKIVSLSYSDLVPFEGHEPLGFHVDQKLFGFRNTRFAVLEFSISVDNSANMPDEIYVGFWGDVKAPNNQNRKSSTNDRISFDANSLAPYIFDGSIEGDEIPLLGAKILGLKDPIVSWWTADEEPANDQERYLYLQGKIPPTDPTENGDYRFLISYGPLSLKSGMNIRFPVALVQAPQLSDFKDNIHDAGEFFVEELGGISLKKQAFSGDIQMASASFIPKAFRLYQNFPNPFNPETKIQFDLPQASQVELRIYNSLGQLVRKLAERTYPAGTHAVVWDGRDDNRRLLPSGIYFYRITAGAHQAEKKLLLLK